MAKDKTSKPDQQEVAAPEAAEVQAAAAPQEPVAPPPAPVAPAAPSQPTPPPAPQIIDLQDACRRLIPKFPEHWWPSIRAHADSQGFGKGGTLEQCKALLKHWGAKI